MEGIAKGVTRLRVPLPWLTTVELIETAPRASMTDSLSMPSAFTFTCKVISTMLDIAPVVPTALYLSAADDFMFYWPVPPGLYEVDPPALAKEKAHRTKIPLEYQVNLPLEPVLFESRAVSQPPLPEFSHPLKYVEDFFRYWCRALPYRYVDSNDEPIPDAQYCFTPAYGNLDSAGWTPDVNNSWYICQDYLSLFSRTFLFYHGSIGTKVLVAPNSPDPYKYMANRFRQVGRFKAHNPFTSLPTVVPAPANFGIGAAVTPSSLQPVIEFTCPFISRRFWQYTNAFQDSLYQIESGQDGFPKVATNVQLINGDGDLTDSLFRKAGADFSLAVETLPPSPFLWRSCGNDWI